MNAINMPISKQNNVLSIVPQKVHNNEWNFYNLCQPQKCLLTKKKVPANPE